MRRFAASLGLLIMGCGSSGHTGNSPLQHPDGGGGDTKGGGGTGSSSGGSQNGGSQNGGGVSGSGGASDGSGGSTPIPDQDAAPQKCTSVLPLPAGTPTLKEGVWSDISPKGLNFTGQPQTGSFTQGIAVDPCNPAVIWVAVDDFDVSKGGLYRTSNGGVSWSKIGLFDQPTRIRIDPKNPKHVYVGDGVRGNTQGFWFSFDGGSTWSKPPNWDAFPATIGIANCAGLSDVYDIAVDPTDFQHVLVTLHSPYSWCDSKYGSDAGVLESKDGGMTWVAHTPIQGTAEGHGISFLGKSTTWLLGTQGSGYWRTTDSGSTWSKVSTVDMAHGGGQTYRTKAGVLYTSSQSKVLRSTDDGLTWTEVGSETFTTSVFGDGNLLYVHNAYGGNGATPFSTSPESDGLTWTQQPTSAGTFTDGPFEVAFDSTNRILYAANWGNGVLALKVP